MKMKRMISFIIICIMMLSVAGCSNSEQSSAEATDSYKIGIVTPSLSSSEE